MTFDPVSTSDDSYLIHMAEEQVKEKEGEGLCKIEASVPTGLEIGAAEECKEVFGRPAEPSRGRLSFQLNSVDELTAVRSYYWW